MSEKGGERREARGRRGRGKGIEWVGLRGEGEAIREDRR